MFATVLTTAAPAAAVGDAPARLESMLIAPICQSFPGTYRARLDTAKMCAASQKRTRDPHSERTTRHVCTSTA